MDSPPRHDPPPCHSASPPWPEFMTTSQSRNGSLFQSSSSLEATFLPTFVGNRPWLGSHSSGSLPVCICICNWDLFCFPSCYCICHVVFGTSEAHGRVNKRFPETYICLRPAQLKWMHYSRMVCICLQAKPLLTTYNHVWPLLVCFD